MVNKNLENVGVSASISLANQVHKKEFSAVVKANGGRGFPSFLSRETLADNKSSYLPAGHLDIICRFTFYVYKNMKPVGDVALFSKEPLKISMERLLCDTTLSDIIIMSGSESFPCHRSILANRYFFTRPNKFFSTWPSTFFRPCINGIARIILSTLGENKSFCVWFYPINKKEKPLANLFQTIKLYNSNWPIWPPKSKLLASWFTNQLG